MFQEPFHFEKGLKAGTPYTVGQILIFWFICMITSMQDMLLQINARLSLYIKVMYDFWQNQTHFRIFVMYEFTNKYKYISIHFYVTDLLWFHFLMYMDTPKLEEYCTLYFDPSCLELLDKPWMTDLVWRLWTPQLCLYRYGMMYCVQGCMVNGSIYAEGSAMDSSTHCQYCYCIKGQQHCVRPQCLLSQPDCIPTYSTDSCCPAKYNCSKPPLHHICVLLQLMLFLNSSF